MVEIADIHLVINDREKIIVRFTLHLCSGCSFWQTCHIYFWGHSGGFIFIIFNVFVFWKFFISIRGWLPIRIDILLSRFVSVYCFICIGIVVGIIGGGWKIHIGGRVVGPLLSTFGFLFLRVWIDLIHFRGRESVQVRIASGKHVLTGTYKVIGSSKTKRRLWGACPLIGTVKMADAMGLMSPMSFSAYRSMQQTIPNRLFMLFVPFVSN
jgi:hypothetical protein